MGGVGCRLANYSVAYEEARSNRVFDFRNFVILCVLCFQRQSFFTFILQVTMTIGQAYSHA